MVNSPIIFDTLVADDEGAKTASENFCNCIADCAIFRSKVRWYEEGEKCSKYFRSLEKRNKIIKLLYSQITHRGWSRNCKPGTYKKRN